MEDYKRGSHTVWDCKYPLVWTRKYRYQVLGGEVGERCRELLREIARLRKRYWGQHLWERGYWVCTSGNVSDEVWQRYIEDQKAPEPDDDFKVI